MSLRRLIKQTSNLCYRFWVNYGAKILGSRFYGNWFYKACEIDNKKSHPVIAQALAASLNADSVVDFGCGDGRLLCEFAKVGVDGIGYEFSKTALRLCRQRGVIAKELDFRNQTLPSPPPVGRLVICLEVVEHLRPENADFLCDLLSCCRGSKWLVFSGATPGQGGEGHFNEQPHEYWRRKLELRGWHFNPGLTENQRVTWRQKGVAFYYWQNVQIFENTL